MKILVINGPNLNMLGKREPEVYGNVTLEEIESLMTEASSDKDVELEFYQSNHEGEIVTRIQQAEQDCEALIINPAAFTHTSVAIRDALASVSVPAIEVHISNIHARETFRQTSYTAPVTAGVITGFGKYSYLLGLHAAMYLLEEKQ